MNGHKPFMESEHIFLRTVEIDDAPFLAYCYNSPDSRPTFFTSFPKNTQKQVEIIKNLYEPPYEYVPFIICEKESKEAVGVTAFHRMDMISRSTVFSIIIPDNENWGKGYGSDATELMVEYGFDILNLNRIQLHVFAENIRGINAYEKAGFLREGLLRQAMYHNDRYCDFYIMAILREDYYGRKDEIED